MIAISILEDEYQLGREAYKHNIYGRVICQKVYTPVMVSTFCLKLSNSGNSLENKVLVERVGFYFFVEVEYENLPEFYSLCNCTGHVRVHCNNKTLLIKPIADKYGPRNKNVPPKTYVQVEHKGRNVVSEPGTKVIEK